MRRERHVAALLPEVFRRSGLTRGMERAHAVVLWPHVVGPEVARFSTAVGLQQGTLVVDVPDPETALHLGMQRHHILAAYHDRLGHAAVREVRFRVGRPPESPPVTPPAVATVDPEAMATLARSLQDVHDTVAASALRAGKALLTWRARRAAEGWRPCPVCETLHEVAAPRPDDPLAGLPGASSWCPICRRQALSPAVQRAATRLSVAPDDPCPTIVEDERRVAVHLARGRMVATLRELLPQAVADPALRPLLLRAACVVAALRSGRGVHEVDAEALAGAVDPRVLRALGPLATDLGAITRTQGAP
jgi:hypothetical protein